MTTEIVLTSPTTFLRIILETENCSFTHSLDGSIIYVETTNNNFITRSDLSLINPSNEEIWSASMPSRGTFNQERIRVDSIFPLVFNKDETVQVFPSLLLVASSPFFEGIFNGNFQEKEKGFYEIKEVSSVDFQWFIESFHKRKWEFSSMDRALLALSYADQFELLYLHSRVYPYLKNNELPKNSIEETLLLCSKFKGIDKLILWVLNHCDSEQEALQLLQKCAPQMNTMAIQAAFKALALIFQRKKQQAVQHAVHGALETGIENIRPYMTSNCILVNLRCFDLDGSVGHESAFAVNINDERNVDWWDIFRNIPTGYVVAKYGGSTGMRTGGEFAVSRYDRILRVDAYRK